MPVAAWLLSIAWPIVAQVLVSMGIGVLTYTGLSLIGGQVQGAVVSAYGGLTGDMADVLGLAGIPQGMGIILGSINARIAFIAVGKIGKVTA